MKSCGNLISQFVFKQFFILMAKIVHMFIPEYYIELFEIKLES